MNKRILLATMAIVAAGGTAFAQGTAPAPSTAPRDRAPVTTPSTTPGTTPGNAPVAPPATASPATGASWTAGMSANDLIGKPVYNAAGDRIGEVDDLVLPKSGASSTGSASTAAVIGVGGFLGMGERKVAVPLNQLRMDNDKLTAASTMTKDSLKAMPEYDADDYTKVDRNKRLGS